MIDVTPELSALFESDVPFVMADILTITLQPGTALRYTNHDVNLDVGGNVYYSNLPFNRSGIKTSSGLSVAEMSCTFYPTSGNTINGVGFIASVQRGIFDSAIFLLERVFYLTDWKTYIGKIHRFEGRTSEIQDFDRSEVPISVKSWAELLDVQVPVNVYQPSCRYVLYGAGCTLSKSSNTFNSSALAGSTTRQILCGLSQAGPATGSVSGQNIGTGDGNNVLFSAAVTYIPTIVTAVYLDGQAIESGWTGYFTGFTINVALTTAPADGVVVTANFDYAQAGYFELGTLVFTSGENEGVSRSIKSYAPGVINFVFPLPFDPASGDTFTVYPGCDKQMSTCGAKFNNLANFGGEPFIPVPETAY